MTDYSELVKALRYCGKDLMPGERCKDSCPYGDIALCLPKLKLDAAAAIEALDRLLDQNTQRCEALRKQLREAHESYEMHLNELEQQMPKRGEWIHGREIGKEWIYDHWVAYYEDWHCSNCKVVFEQEEKPNYNYCPNCGAKMEVQE